MYNTVSKPKISMHHNIISFLNYVNYLVTDAFVYTNSLLSLALATFSSIVLYAYSYCADMHTLYWLVLLEGIEPLLSLPGTIVQDNHCYKGSHPSITFAFVQNPYQLLLCGAYDQLVILMFAVRNVGDSNVSYSRDTTKPGLWTGPWLDYRPAFWIFLVWEVESMQSMIHLIDKGATSNSHYWKTNTTLQSSI